MNNIYKKVKASPVKSKASSQNGLSLVELLVSMVMGLFLLGGVITNFVGTKDSDRMRSAISQMDADARSAISALRGPIQHAGYPSIDNIILEKAFYTRGDSAIVNPLCANGQRRDTNTPIPSDQTRDGIRTDIITVISMADNPCRLGLASCPDIADVNPEAQVYTDGAGGGADRGVNTVSCSTDRLIGMGRIGNSTDARLYSTFRVGGPRSDNGEDNTRTLYVSGNRGGSQPVADNIEAMQILYGFQQDNGNTVYRSAGGLGVDDWGAVTSVQIALLVRSANANLLKVDSTQTRYTLLGDRRHQIQPQDLRRLFRIYTTTIHLANQNRGRILR